MKFNYKALLALLPIFASGQAAAQKKQLTPEGYTQWYQMATGLLSHTGKWTTYTMLHTDGRDTLFLKNTVVGITRSFPSGRGESFSPNDEWFAHVAQDTVKLLSLYNGVRRSFDGYTSCSFLAGGVYFCAQNKEEGKVKLLNLKDFRELELDTVTEVSIAKNGKKLALVVLKGGSASVRYIDLDKALDMITLPQAGKGEFTSPVWSDNCQSLALLRKTAEVAPGIPDYEAWLYKDVSAKTKPMRLCRTDAGFLKGDYILRSGLYVTADASTVLFDTARIPAAATDDVKEKPIVQIWHNNESQLPPSEKTTEWFATRAKWTAWLPGSGNTRVLEKQDYASAVLVEGGRFALLYDTGNYRPQHLYNGDYTDLYCMELATGEIRSVTKKIPLEYARTIVLKSGSDIVFFKERQWWSYNCDTQKTVCLTSGLGVAFEFEEFDRPREKGPYGCGGWVDGDKYILLYDRFDTWMISPDGFRKVRLTRGREDNRVWRMVKTGTGEMVRDSYSGFTVKDFSLAKGFLLKFTDEETNDEGLGLYTKKGLRELLRVRAALVDIQQTDDAKIIAFTETRFDESPHLLVRDESGKITPLAQANAQQSHYNWGKSELVHYTVNGVRLKGVLIWPAGYIPGKKYPMIVNIYEKKSQLLHEYYNPATELDDGVNVTDFSLEGYFVLLPDIVFTPNQPGRSALNCVTAAVNAVLEKGIIDKDAIGLTGHSFGGYETALIITQTDIFKAAVCRLAGYRSCRLLPYPRRLGRFEYVAV